MELGRSVTRFRRVTAWPASLRDSSLELYQSDYFHHSTRQTRSIKPHSVYPTSLAPQSVHASTFSDRRSFIRFIKLTSPVQGPCRLRHNSNGWPWGLFYKYFLRAWHSFIQASHKILQSCNFPSCSPHPIFINV
jgi:hypothetical protein